MPSGDLGPRSKSAMSTWNGSPQRELATNTLSGKLGADHAAYRSQSEAEASFRQMKDPRVASFSPMFHWTEHNIRVHTFTCVLALQLAHLMRRRAARAGLDMYVRALLAELAGISETVLLYPGDRGRPRAHRMLTDTTPVQDKLIKIFGLDRYAPRR